MRLISQEVLGTGALFGRFDHLEFPPLEDVYGLELADRLVHKYGLAIPKPVAGYLVNRCGGNPFYIRCVVLRAVKQSRQAIEVAARGIVVPHSELADVLSTPTTIAAPALPQPHRNGGYSARVPSAGWSTTSRAGRSSPPAAVSTCLIQPVIA